MYWGDLNRHKFPNQIQIIFDVGYNMSVFTHLIKLSLAISLQVQLHVNLIDKHFMCHRHQNEAVTCILITLKLETNLLSGYRCSQTPFVKELTKAKYEDVIIVDHCYGLIEKAV